MDTRGRAGAGVRDQHGAPQNTQIDVENDSQTGGKSRIKIDNDSQQDRGMIGAVPSRLHGDKFVDL